ncbi:MAG: hypothetical protein R6W78_13010 [Bacteroidales bacterium]
MGEPYIYISESIPAFILDTIFFVPVPGDNGWKLNVAKNPSGRDRESGSAGAINYVPVLLLKCGNTRHAPIQSFNEQEDIRKSQFVFKES